MAHHHHKANKAVEGDPDTGHRGGMPRRPDDEELEERTMEDREEMGLDPDPRASRRERSGGEDG
jgi:hypothetical protein